MSEDAHIARNVTQAARRIAAAEQIYEVHGSIHHLQCTTPCADDVWPAEEVEVIVDPETMLAQPPLPRCPRCGALARPNVLMFGDLAGRPTRHRRGDARLIPGGRRRQRLRARETAIPLTGRGGEAT